MSSSRQGRGRLPSITEEAVSTPSSPPVQEDGGEDHYYEDLLAGDKFLVSGMARKDLIKWCSFPWEEPPFKYTVSGLHLSDAWTYMVLLGGIEKVSTLVNEYSLDVDGTGIVTEDQYKEQGEFCMRLIDQNLDFLINSGVVGALLLSVLFPICLTPLVPSDESVMFFGETGVMGLLVSYFIFIYLSLFLSFWITYMTIHYYLHISLWMPTFELKLWYCNELNTLPAVVVLTHGCVLASAFCLPFGIALAITPEAGLLALVFDLIMLGYMAFNILSPTGGDAALVRELHGRFQQMLIKDGCLEIKEEPVEARNIEGGTPRGNNTC